MSRNSIGQFIAALRKANGMTQQDVADRLNVSNKAVSRWERDECAPDLSVIPALAEMFGVTCDELLKGERIIEGASPEKKEIKVEKQVKALIARTLSDFKSFTYISIAIALVGLICMFGISYGFYRPTIGFAVMLLFDVGAFAVTLLAVNKAKEAKNGNELFEMAELTQTEEFNRTLGTLSFAAFFTIFASVALSLPLVLVSSSYYVNSVLTLDSYLSGYFSWIAIGLIFLFYFAKPVYVRRLTGTTATTEEDTAVCAPHKKLLNRLQIGAAALVAVLFIYLPYLSTGPDSIGVSIGVLIPIGISVASIVCFGIFLSKYPEERSSLLLPGIRNILFLVPAWLASCIHSVGWISYSENGIKNGTTSSYDIWTPKYAWICLALVAAIWGIFTLIERKHKNTEK